MNLVSTISRHEAGELDDAETDALFQRLLDTGILWSLQGSYQLTAQNLLRLGRIRQTNTSHD